MYIQLLLYCTLLKILNKNNNLNPISYHKITQSTKNQGVRGLSKVYLPELLQRVSAGEVLEADSNLRPASILQSSHL